MWGAVAQVVVLLALLLPDGGHAGHLLGHSVVQPHHLLGQLVHLLPGGCHAGHILGHTVVQLDHLLGHMSNAVAQVVFQLIHLLPVGGHAGHLLGHPTVQLGLCHFVLYLVHRMLLHVNCYLFDGTQHTWWQPSL